MTKPFRWNISKREQLGSLVSHALETSPRAEPIVDDIRNAAARILALGDNSDYAFIGRTPENFYDYLSGIFAGLDEAPRLHIVQFSLRWAGEGGILSIPETKRIGFFNYLKEEGLDPASIASAPHPLALVDFVVDGGTMENLVRLLKLFSEREGVDWNAVQRRLRIIGLRIRTKNSPNTWRWQQNQQWLDLIPDTEIVNVSAPFEFLCHLGNDQPKLTRAHQPENWDRFDTRRKPPTANQLKALRFSVELFDLGRTRAERQKLAALIARTHQIRQPATRSLVSKLK